MLINGENLTTEQIALVKSAYIYRNTIENLTRLKSIGFSSSFPVLITDEQWIKEHAFYFVKSGNRLAKTHKHCEPSYMADCN